MSKRILYLLVISFCLLFGANQVKAQENINIYFFWRDGCPHCANEEPFLETLEQKYDNVTVFDFEVSKNKENRNLLSEVGKKLDVSVSGVPFTVIGNQSVVGWSNESITGGELERLVNLAQTGEYQDVVGPLLSDDNNSSGLDEDNKDETADDSSPKLITVPIFGELNIKSLSLPMLAVVLGMLDGFNPCAMWALLFLISLLVGMKDKRRMWIFGSVFIVGSVAVYFIFMAAWLNILLFIGVVFWVQVLIGLLALWGGYYNLKEFFTNKNASCKVTSGQKRERIFDRLKTFAQQKSFWLGLLGILILAFSVNLVELICSAGLPAVFTQALVLSDLSTWQYYGYILLYILFFMIDDLFVFFVAMKTLQVTGISTKYARFSHLIGGILMLIIGLLLIFKPEWLMFG